MLLSERGKMDASDSDRFLLNGIDSSIGYYVTHKLSQHFLDRVELPNRIDTPPPMEMCFLMW